MPLNHRSLALACLATLLPAQAEPPPPSDPVTLVSRAEQLAAADIEGAVLLLWRALPQLERPGADSECQAAAGTARRLLRKHDPHHDAWLQANAVVAKHQATLAAMYRRKKWYDTAATKLLIAERFDRAVSRKERIAFDKLRREVTTTPTAASNGETSKQSELFDRSNTVLVDGPWQPVDGVLESGAHDGKAVVATWLTKTKHADSEIVVELRPVDPRADRNAGLVFGATDARNYYCARFGSLAKNKYDFIEILQVKDNVETRLAGISERNAGKVGAAHRFVLHVRDSHVRFQVDNRRPVEADTGTPVRGQLGLCVGVTGFSSCPLRFGRFDVGPLPGSEPTAEELRAQQESNRRREVVAAVDLAKTEIANKNLEEAASRLRRARSLLHSLTADADRTETARSIDALIPKADRQHAKCTKAERESAAALVTLADRYAAAAMPRAASALVRTAAEFTPLELLERESRAQREVEAWRAGREPKPAAAGEPSVENSAALHNWFREGRPLYSHSTVRWVVEGRSARVDQLERGQIATLMPRDGLPALSRATVAVLLPSIGAAAGFCFDVAGSHDFAVAMLEHTDFGIVLTAQRWRDKKWAPLGKETIELPLSKRSSWLELEIEATDQGLTARSAGKTVTIGKASLGAGTGPYGLVVTNSGVPATVELAAFRFAQ